MTVSIKFEKKYLYISSLETDETSTGSTIITFHLDVPIPTVIGSLYRIPVNNVDRVYVHSANLSTDEIVRRAHEFDSNVMIDITGLTLDVSKPKFVGETMLIDTRVWLVKESFAKLRGNMDRFRNI